MPGLLTELLPAVSLDAALAAALTAADPRPATRAAGLPLGKPRWLGKLWTGIGLG